MLKPNKILRIGVDLMGHDNDPEALLASMRQLSFPEHVRIFAVGLPKYEHLAAPLEYRVASEVIEMDDPPLQATRAKKDSSLCVGLRLLKAKEIDVFISAGNTGALVSASKIILGMEPNLSRPALLTLLPTKKHPVAVLDLGANTEVKAAHYLQFALMGAAYQHKRGIKNPRVGLLNIGEEPTKGPAELRLAYKKLQSLSSPPFQFVGNVEPTAVFQGNIDVLITDGFTGNIFLKTSESIANFFLNQLSTYLPKEIFESHLLLLQKHMHYAEYPGAFLTGVQGIVIKCHGYSTPQSFASTIQTISATFF